MIIKLFGGYQISANGFRMRFLTLRGAQSFKAGRGLHGIDPYRKIIAHGRIKPISGLVFRKKLADARP